jgi:hypothetical protein
MTKLLEEVKKQQGFDVFAFWDKDFDGGCPCFGGKHTESGKTVSVHGRCWRVSDNINRGYQDLYVWGSHPDLKEIAEETQRALDETEWYNPYTIIYEEFV